MAKIYLPPGFQFCLLGGPVRIGASGTVVDAVPDWKGIANYCGDDVIGTIVRDGLTFNLFLEEDTGKLWYDDGDGF